MKGWKGIIPPPLKISLEIAVRPSAGCRDDRVLSRNTSARTSYCFLILSNSSRVRTEKTSRDGSSGTSRKDELAPSSGLDVDGSIPESATPTDMVILAFACCPVRRHGTNSLNPNSNSSRHPRLESGNSGASLVEHRETQCRCPPTKQMQKKRRRRESYLLGCVTKVETRFSCLISADRKRIISGLQRLVTRSKRGFRDLI